MTSQVEPNQRARSGSRSCGTNLNGPSAATANSPSKACAGTRDPSSWSRAGSEPATATVSNVPSGMHIVDSAATKAEPVDHPVDHCLQCFGETATGIELTDQNVEAAERRELYCRVAHASSDDEWWRVAYAFADSASKTGPAERAQCRGQAPDVPSDSPGPGRSPWSPDLPRSPGSPPPPRRSAAQGCVRWLTVRTGRGTRLKAEPAA